WISREEVPLDSSAEDHAARSWEPLLDEVLASKLRIAWYGDRLLFASDTPGPGAALTDRATANLWSVAADGSDLRSHTSLTSAEGYLANLPPTAPASCSARAAACSRWPPSKRPRARSRCSSPAWAPPACRAPPRRRRTCWRCV